jgi:integrase
MDRLPEARIAPAEIRELRELIGELSTEITMLTEVIASLLAGHAGYQVIRRLPGVGPVVAAIIIAAVSYVGSWDRGRGRRLIAFFAVLYCAGLRPAEAVALREGDCHLPASGWGTLTLARTLPVTTKKWTNDGVRHDLRGLKQRDPDAILNLAQAWGYLQRR